MKEYVRLNIENTKKIMKKIGPTRYTQLRVNRYLPIVQTILAHVNNNVSVLDVGSREGALLKVFKEHGFEDLSCIDIYAEGMEIATKDGFNAEVADIMEYNPGRVFGVVIMSHVLEHCPDVREALRNVYNCLVMGGLLYVEVPQHKGKPIDHAHYYNFDSMISLLRVFDEDMWDILEVTKNRERTRLKALVRKI